MSKTSNMQKLEVLRVWLDDLKKNNRYRKQQKKTPDWLAKTLKELELDEN